MGLTRPRFSQFDTTISSISDPITVLNKSSTLANIDIGFIMNRNGGALSNVAIIWQESAGAFALAFTGNTGEVTPSISNSNVAVITYANLVLNSLTANSITTNGNVTATNFIGSGALLTGLPASYSNVNVVAYTQSMGFTNYSNVNVVAYTQTQSYTNYSNVNVKAYTESMGFQNYGNTNVKAYTESMGFQNYGNTNVIAYTQSMGFQNYGNVNLAAYLGGAVTVGGNLTVQGNLIVQGTTTTLNSTTLDVSDLNITVAKGAASAAAANGAGLTVDGASATLLYTSATDTWNINKGLVVSSAGNVTINNTAVTTNTITGALTVAGGVGIAGTISVGGTLLAGNVSGTAGQVLTSTGAGLTWSTAGGGSANQPFSLTSNDFGSDLSGYTVSEDQGDLSAGSTSYDLAYIATLGPITASLLELPSYTTSALPTGQTGGALAYDSSVQNVKFNNGTAWANVAPTYYQIDDLGLAFDGITTTFALTYNDGASISPTNPNQLKIRIGGVDISPFRYSDDLVNLSGIARFDRGFRIVSGNISFASPPSPGMEFYGTVQANEEAEPQFVFKQTPFSAINIQYGY